MMKADIVIVGGGPAGIAASTVSAGLGARVVLIDENSRIGGKVFSHKAERLSGFGAEAIENRIRNRLFKSFQDISGKITVYSDTQVWHIDDRKEVYLESCSANNRVPPSIKGRTLVIATGAMERMIPFPGWTLPGIFSAGGLNTLVRKGVIPGKRFLIAGTGPLQIALARNLIQKNAKIAAIVSPVSFKKIISCIFDFISGAGIIKLVGIIDYFSTIKSHRIPVLTESLLLEASETDSWHQAVIGRMDSMGNILQGSRRIFSVDAVATGYGLIPSTDLTRSCGCSHYYDERAGCWRTNCNKRMETSLDGVFVAGDGSAIRGYSAAIEEGKIAGIEACVHLGVLSRKKADEMTRPSIKRLERFNRFGRVLDFLSLPDPGAYRAIPDQTVICRCEEVTMGDVKKAVADGAEDINDMKRRTRLGMGHCQGRFCGQVICELIEQLSGKYQVREWFTPRIPAKPVTFRTLAK